MKAKCKRTFSVDRCDDDGFSIPNKYKTIKADSVWEVDESKQRIAGGEVRLVSEKYGWLELSQEHFESDFEIVQ